MNIFYAPPEQISGKRLSLTGQEAHHAQNALRYEAGDDITVVDGEGGWYEGVVSGTYRDRLEVMVNRSEVREPPRPRTALGLGIVKKKDRLEFAVEKAVELGARQVFLFRSEHTVKENVRMDRLEIIARSAMKQSLRAYLPEIRFYASFAELLDEWDDAPVLAAHQEGEPFGLPGRHADANRVLLLVGPEGGFSPGELALVDEKGGITVSLGNYRLRTETAAVAFLSRFVSGRTSR